MPQDPIISAFIILLALVGLRLLYVYFDHLAKEWRRIIEGYFLLACVIGWLAVTVWAGLHVGGLLGGVLILAGPAGLLKLDDVYEPIKRKLSRRNSN
jgi:hypothetical protein